MLGYLMVLFLLSGLAQDDVRPAGTTPLVFGEGMPIASDELIQKVIGTVESNMWLEEMSWRGGILKFIGNNSTENLTNVTEVA